MFKHFTFALLTVLSLAAASAHALPIQNADAFENGDQLAAYDPSTGITWMDFGVNNGNSFNTVIDALNTVYEGWRLPTETEVRDLWGKLAASVIDNNYEIFSLFGANKVPSKDHLPYLCYGNFIDDNGFIAHGSFLENGNIINDFGADKYYSDGALTGGVYASQSIKYNRNNPYFNFGGTAEISTLLVRNTNVSVSEPSSFILLAMGLLSLGIFRRKLRH